mmetsp:Transcript_23309/g.60759  ORF Transcript_23309/g.60759 Transcript_23309/m.60759 type:complete len:356 (+) Transcript_23309:2591-3658(+)
MSSGVLDNPTATGITLVTTSEAWRRATAGAASANAKATSSALDLVSGSNCAAFAAAPTKPNNWPASAAKKAGASPAASTKASKHSTPFDSSFVRKTCVACKTALANWGARTCFLAAEEHRIARVHAALTARTPVSASLDRCCCKGVITSEMLASPVMPNLASSPSASAAQSVSATVACGEPGAAFKPATQLLDAAGQGWVASLASSATATHNARATGGSGPLARACHRAFLNPSTAPAFHSPRAPSARRGTVKRFAKVAASWRTAGLNWALPRHETNSDASWRGLERCCWAKASSAAFWVLGSSWAARRLGVSWKRAASILALILARSRAFCGLVLGTRVQLYCELDLAKRDVRR